MRPAEEIPATREYVKKSLGNVCKRLIGEIEKFQQVPNLHTELQDVRNMLSTKEDRGMVGKLQTDMLRLADGVAELRRNAADAAARLKHICDHLSAQAHRAEDVRERVVRLEATSQKLSEQVARLPGPDSSGKLQRTASTPAPASSSGKVMDDAALGRLKAEWKAEVLRDVRRLVESESKIAAQQAVQAHIEYDDDYSQSQDDDDLDEEEVRPVHQKRKAVEEPEPRPTKKNKPVEGPTDNKSKEQIVSKKKTKEAHPKKSVYPSATDATKMQAQKDKGKPPPSDPKKKKSAKQKKGT